MTTLRKHQTKQCLVFSSLEETIFSMAEIERKQQILQKQEYTHKFHILVLAKYCETHNCRKIIGGVLIDMPIASSAHSSFAFF